MKRNLNALETEAFTMLQKLDSLQLVALYRGLRRLHRKELARGAGIDLLNRPCASSLARVSYAHEESISGKDFLRCVMDSPMIPGERLGYLININDRVLGGLTPKQRFTAFERAVTAVLAERGILQSARLDAWRRLFLAF